MDRILNSTLVYAEPSSYEIFIEMNNITKAEIFCGVGCFLLLGIHGVRNHRYAWSTKTAQTVIRLTELLTCRQYEIIGTFFHLVTPNEEQQLVGNRLSKVYTSSS